MAILDWLIQSFASTLAESCEQAIERAVPVVEVAPALHRMAVTALRQQFVIQAQHFGCQAGEKGLRPGKDLRRNSQQSFCSPRAYALYGESCRMFRVQTQQGQAGSHAKPTCFCHVIALESGVHVRAGAH